MRRLTLREYDYLTVDTFNKKVLRGKRLAVCIPQSVFDYLERLLEKEECRSDADDYTFFLSREGQSLFQVQSYVGVLQTPCGTQIEILPKISDVTEHGDEQSRIILLQMLRYLKKAKFKLGGDASLRKAPMHLLELFIAYFLQEVNQLVKRGIRSDYVTREENQAFLKGKLLVNQQIRVNSVQQQRFYVAHDEYVPNRAENRLLHTALVKVSKISQSPNNQRLSRELMLVFSDVPVSNNIRQDFAKCKDNRAMCHYQHALEWCHLILQEESTVPSAGVIKTISILFPMEKIFEDYVAAMLRKLLLPKGYQVTTQATGKYLCVHAEATKKIFALRPDILITHKEKGCWVADTKWKLIHNEHRNYGISQSDMYQLYAYGKKYENCQGLFLIYPKTSKFDKDKTFSFDENLGLICTPFDCLGNSHEDQFEHAISLS